jgi:hypothetical protein
MAKYVYSKQHDSKIEKRKKQQRLYYLRKKREQSKEIYDDLMKFKEDNE